MSDIRERLKRNKVSDAEVSGKKYRAFEPGKYLLEIEEQKFMLSRMKVLMYVAKFRVVEEYTGTPQAVKVGQIIDFITQRETDWGASNVKSILMAASGIDVNDVEGIKSQDWDAIEMQAVHDDPSAMRGWKLRADCSLRTKKEKPNETYVRTDFSPA